MLQSNIESLPLLHRGKVRDIYSIDDDHLLFVATDRISAFDVILPNPIPGKGVVLTRLSQFWFARFASGVPNHLTLIAPSSVVTAKEAVQIEGRALVVKRLKPIAIEAIVRGYLIGSGWKDYQANGSVCEIALPAGLPQAARLPSTLFTPSTKAAMGAHDENISFARAAAVVGEEIAQTVRELSVRLYEDAAKYALQRGIIIADTKFEYGLDELGQITLMDEVLTPDSSRFWAADEYRTGISPPSFDKQIIRDYLEGCNWNKTAPAPALPAEIVSRVALRYREVADRLMAPD